MHFPEKDKIFSKLDKILTSPTKIIVGVSGGPDSRLAFALLSDFYSSKGRDQQLLIVAHFHHGQRKESDKEQQQIFKWYENYHVYYNVDKPKKGQKETAMRILRKEFFQEVCEKEKASYLATGHHLDDRIETSFMNLLRGTSLQGLGNMTFSDYKEGCFQIRPLISLQKRYIEELCRNNNISYFIDETNKNSSLTIRNALRNDVFPQLNIHSTQSRWYESRALIYSQIERKAPNTASDKVWLIPLSSHPRRGTEYIYQIKLGSPNKSGKYTENDRAFIFQTLNIYKKVSQNNLAEWVRFSNTSQDGYKFIADVYFFISHGNIYAIKGGELFREYEKDIKMKISTKDHKIDFDSNRIPIKPERRGAIIRYVKPGDSYKGKRVKKRMLNQKIPLFRRNFVPVIEKNGKIIDVVKEIVPSFYMKD